MLISCMGKGVTQIAFDQYQVCPTSSNNRKPEVCPDFFNWAGQGEALTYARVAYWIWGYVSRPSVVALSTNKRVQANSSM